MTWVRPRSERSSDASAVSQPIPDQIAYLLTHTVACDCTHAQTLGAAASRAVALVGPSCSRWPGIQPHQKPLGPHRRIGCDLEGPVSTADETLSKERYYFPLIT